MRLRSKTILGVGLIEVVLLAILVTSALSALRDSNEQELMRRLRLGVQLITVAAKDAVISQDLATLESLVDEVMASRQIAYVRVLDDTGAILAQRGDTAVLARPFQADANVAQATDGVLDGSAQVLSSGIRHGEVQMGVSTAPLQTLLASALRWAGGIAGLEIVLVALFSWLLGSYLVRQLTELRQASQRLAAGDFAQRVPVRGDDEVAETAVAFNSMAQQLGISRDQLHDENQKRLQAQQFAQEQAAQLGIIFELSPDGFVAFDLNWRVNYVSPAFTRMTGLSLTQLRGVDEQGFTNLLVSRCRADAPFRGFEALRTSALQHRLTQRELFELASPARLTLEVGLRASDAGAVSQILYFRDVTLEKEVDRVKSEFLAAAAHELRTPMASIYGFAEILMNDEHDAASRHEFLSIIWKHSQWMMSILNELLDLARMEERGIKDFVFEMIPAQSLLKDAVQGFVVPAGRAAPHVLLPVKPLELRADPKKVLHALLNLLSNAYKFSPTGGAVSVTLEAIESGMVAIRVCDQGMGMTAEQVGRVGERFYRADASGTVLGVGLGMSIVKEIVDLHRGQLQIDSLPGRGTTVSLLLPAVG